MKRKILICVMAFLVGCAIGSLTGCATRDDIEFYTSVDLSNYPMSDCSTCSRYYENDN